MTLHVGSNNRFVSGLTGCLLLLLGCSSPTNPAQPDPTKPSTEETTADHAISIAVRALQAEGIDVSGWRVLVIEDSLAYDVSFSELQEAGRYGDARHVVVSKKTSAIVDTFLTH